MKKSSRECRAHFYNFYFDGPFVEQLGLSNQSAYLPHVVPYLMKTNTLEPPRGDLNHFIHNSMAGYRFARSDFDVPFDNSAESLLRNSIIENDDQSESDLETNRIIPELNCAVIRAYNHRLKERKRRYKIVSDHGLILQRKTLAWLSRYSEVFRNSSDIGKFAAFMQISDPTSFDFLMESLKHFLDTKRELYR